MKLKRSQQGFTVVEVLIAAAIVLVGLTAAMSAVSAGFLDVAASGGQSKATTYARQLLEQLKNQPFDPGPTNGTDNPEAPAATGYVRSWTVTSTGAAPNRLATIGVTVAWRNGWSRAQTATLQTMRAECSATLPC
jgi:prepilin-type N-terminal cleavage/methylation domain-containing protein